MGRGNYCPSGEMTDQWYIDYDLYLWDDDDHAEYERDYDLLEDDIEVVMEAIKKRFPSFYPATEYGDSYWGERFRLENSFFRVGTADNQWSEAVFIKMRDDLWENEENLAGRHFDSYCRGIKEILLEFFGTIHLRCGPWMSSRLTKEAVPA